MRDVKAVCTGCGVPADECPDTLHMWIEQTLLAGDNDTATGNVHCEGLDDCPGHDTFKKLFCHKCQNEGKHEEWRNA